MNTASAILFATTLSCAQLAQAAAVPPAGDLYTIKGTVHVVQGKSPAFTTSRVEPVFPNTTVSTEDSSAALLKFSDGQIAGLQSNTTLRIRNYQYRPDAPRDSLIVLSLVKGSARFVTGEIGKQNKSAFRLATPNATIGIGGTDFLLVAVDSKMYGHVQSGSIAMTNAAGVQVANAGQNVLAASSRTAVSVVPASSVPSGIFSELLAMPLDPAAIPVKMAIQDATPVVETPAPVVEAPLPVEKLSTPVPLATVTVPSAPEADVAPAQSVPVFESKPLVAPSDLPGPEIVSEPPPATTKAVAIVETLPEEPAVAARREEPAAFSSDKFGTGISAKVGTLGYGGELSVSISDNWVTARFGINSLHYNRNSTQSEISYDFKLQLKTASALLDFYPAMGSFRATIGLMYDNNSIDLTAKPTGATYTINGHIYPTSEVDSVRGSISFSKTAPYLGIGWGNPVAKGKGWGIVTDLGILLQGSPKTSLSAHCAASALACTPSAIQADVDAENAKLQNDLKNLKYWPVLSIGLSYQW